MAEYRTVTTFTCDWTDEHGDSCGERIDIRANESGGDAWRAARERGWASYSNAYVRRSRWKTGMKMLFCPMHATVFRNNHGWGDLESYEPPPRWWRSVYRLVGGSDE